MEQTQTIHDPTTLTQEEILEVEKKMFDQATDTYFEIFQNTEEEDNEMHLYEDLSKVPGYKARCRKFEHTIAGWHRVTNLKEMYAKRALQKWNARIQIFYASYDPPHEFSKSPIGRIRHMHIFLQYDRAISDQSKNACHLHCVLSENGHEVAHNIIKKVGTEAQASKYLKWMCKYYLKARKQITEAHHDILEKKTMSKMTMNDIVDTYETKEEAMMNALPRDVIAIQRTFDEIKKYKMEQERIKTFRPRLLPSNLDGWQLEFFDVWWNNDILLKAGTICHVYDNVDFGQNQGRSGKSTVALWLDYYDGELSVPSGSRKPYRTLVMSRVTDNANDFQEYLCNKYEQGWTKGQNLVIDIARDSYLGNGFFTSIEDTSNGRAMSFKWKGNRVFFDIYRIVILTNQAPTVQYISRPGKEDEMIKETLSPERWLILSNSWRSSR